MGLLLSVLVFCVGVVELLAVYKNVRRNLTYPPTQGNLNSLEHSYRKERRKLCDLGDLHGEAAARPTFRLNSLEDVEIEYDESVVRSRSPNPRTFLVTEKEIECSTDKANPRRFVVTEETSGSLRKTKSQDSIPEFLIREEKNSCKSPDKPRYLLQESAGRSESPIPLPRQFIVSEDELNTVVFDTTSKLIHSKTHSKHEGVHKRPLSPYPSLDLPQTPLVPRNSICNDLEESVEELQDENSRSSSPERVDVILERTANGTTRYTTNKVLVSPSNDTLALRKQRQVITLSSEEKVEDGDDTNIYDAEYLNSLDGVSKAKPVRRGSSSRKTVKRKHDKPSSSNSQDVPDGDDTTKVLSSAADELKRVSDGDVTSAKVPEPFWLIFSGEYTKAMNKDFHGQHFCCWQCDESLTGQRYVLRDDHPYCVSCYESVFANACEKCSRIIGIDSKDLSYKDKHWHEACFNCTTCGESLVDKQFGSKGDRIYCGSCYDQQFASRCDGCHEIFRAGTKKMEYKTRQWHEKCFCCCVCKVPIGTQSFIPREQEIYCAKCYEEKFATRCIKCNKVITSGGVTYKNEPWHRECFTCTHCQKSLAGERFTSRDEKPYCADCFGELFAKRCYACNKPITGIGGTKFISFEDRHWHNDCFFCASCRTSLVGRGFITDQEDIICPECAKQKLS